MNDKECCGMRNGQNANLTAAAFANAIAEGMSVDQLNLLSTFLQLVGEALANIAAFEALCAGQGEVVIDK